MDILSVRGIERIIGIVAGLVCILLGYRLYSTGISRGKAQIEATTSVGRLVMSGIGPGLLFMGVGAVIVFTSLYLSPVTVKTRLGNWATPKDERAPTPGGADQKSSYFQQEIQAGFESSSVDLKKQVTDLQVKNADLTKRVESLESKEQAQGK